MEFMSVTQAAKKWKISERSVRNYCSQGRIEGAFLIGKTWSIPANAQKPERKQRIQLSSRTVLSVLKEEAENNISGGLYHKVQIELTYNSNHMEGSKLTHDQTRFIFETNTIGYDEASDSINVDDIIETTNHFRCIDYPAISTARSSI